MVVDGQIVTPSTSITGIIDILRNSVKIDIFSGRYGPKLGECYSSSGVWVAGGVCHHLRVHVRF
jgi:hypothetical protein